VQRHWCSDAYPIPILYQLDKFRRHIRLIWSRLVYNGFTSKAKDLNLCSVRGLFRACCIIYYRFQLTALQARGPIYLFGRAPSWQPVTTLKPPTLPHDYDGLVDRAGGVGDHPGTNSRRRRRVRLSLTKQQPQPQQQMQQQQRTDQVQINIIDSCQPLSSREYDSCYCCWWRCTG